MADGIAFSMITEPFHKGIAQRQARMPRAAMYSVREAGRVVKVAAKKAAPILKDPNAVTASQLARGTKFRKAGGIGPVMTADRPVRGLLRASIKPTRNIRRVGDMYELKIAPRGARVHLYSGAQEERFHYMAAGEAAGAAALQGIAKRSFDKVWKG